MYKIYKIVDNTNGNVYVGITSQILYKRISSHRNDFKIGNYCSSQEIFKNDDWYYEVIEETDDKSREKYWIQNTLNCINQKKYGFDRKEWTKNYRLKNKTNIKEYEMWRSKKRLKLVCDWIDLLNQY